MSESKYLIVGSSHAGLAALEAIRMQDLHGGITMVTQENCQPYSPTILPYVVSGQTPVENVTLRDQAWFESRSARLRTACKVVRVDPAAHLIVLENGEVLKYEKLLLATGAEPAAPPFPGLEDVDYCVLRTLADTVKLRQNMARAKTAVVLGAGLIAMHAVENLFQAGLDVSVVVRSRILRGYFDQQASSMIERAFTEVGVRMITGSRVRRVSRTEGGCRVELDNGGEVDGGLLLAAMGVKACIGYLHGSGVQVDQGILVDETMRTSAPDIWAAGDVAQAKGFFGRERTIETTLPNAVEQGRIAGMDMAGDPGLKKFRGCVSMNTCNFFGHRAFSVGWVDTTDVPDVDVRLDVSTRDSFYRKMVFKDGRLIGTSGINTNLDPGVMLELIRRRIDLTGIMDRFTSAPQETGRLLMTDIWR